MVLPDQAVPAGRSLGLVVRGGLRQTDSGRLSSSAALHEPERRALLGRRGAMLRAPARFMAPNSRPKVWRCSLSMNQIVLPASRRQNRTSDCRRDAGSTLNGRFMVPMRVQSLEAEALHEPRPLTP